MASISIRMYVELIAIMIAVLCVCSGARCVAAAAHPAGLHAGVRRAGAHSRSCLHGLRQC